MSNTTNRLMARNITVYTKLQITQWEHERRELSALKNEPRKIFSRLSQSNELSNHILSGNRFLSDLTKNPAVLVTDLCTGMRSILHRFEKGLLDPKNHLTVTARNNLAEMKTMLLESEELVKTSSNSGHSYHLLRDQYLAICGLLAKLLTNTREQPSVCYINLGSTYRATESDKPVAEAFINLLNTTHIPFDGDLPDSFSKNVNAMKYYQDTHPWINGEAFSHFEQNEFDTRFKALMMDLNKFETKTEMDDNFVNLAKSIARTVKTGKENSLNEQTEYALSVIKTTHALLKNPTELSAQKELLRLANISEGKPVFSKKLKALMMAFLGTALILSGVLLAVTTGGIATPLSALIIKTGAIWVMTMGIIGAATGVGALMNSASLFNTGRRTGISKQMVDLERINSLRA